MFKTLYDILSDLLKEAVVAFLDAAVEAAHNAITEHRQRVAQRRSFASV